MVQYGCDHSGQRTQIQAVSQEGINFMETKTYCNNHWEGVIKNGHEYL